jgi:hypothetical protein
VYANLDVIVRVYYDLSYGRLVIFVIGWMEKAQHRAQLDYQRDFA